MGGLGRDGDSVTGGTAVAGVPGGKGGGRSVQSDPSALWRGQGPARRRGLGLLPSAAPLVPIACPVAAQPGAHGRCRRRSAPTYPCPRSTRPKQRHPSLSNLSGETASASNARLPRSEEHTSELQSLMRNSYAVFCLKNKNKRAT